MSLRYRPLLLALCACVCVGLATLAGLAQQAAGSGVGASKPRGAAEGTGREAGHTTSLWARRESAVRRADAQVRLTRHVRRTDQPSPRVQVGPLLVPAACPMEATTVDAPQPGGGVAARIATPPEGFDQAVRSAFLQPCSASARTPPGLGSGEPAGAIWFKVDAQIQYSGSEGTVTLVTAKASPGAQAQGLWLGAAAGKLPDGTPVWSQSVLDENDGSTSTCLAWLSGPYIVQMVSTSLSEAQLQAMAPEVTIS